MEYCIPVLPAADKPVLYPIYTLERMKSAANLRGSGTGQAGKKHGASFSGIFRRIQVDNISEFLDGEWMERSIRSPFKSVLVSAAYIPIVPGNAGVLKIRITDPSVVPKGTDIGKRTTPGSQAH